MFNKKVLKPVYVHKNKAVDGVGEREGERDWGEWNEHFQAESNNSSWIKGHIIFFW